MSLFTRAGAAVSVLAMALLALTACSGAGGTAPPSPSTAEQLNDKLDGIDPNFGKNMQACLKQAGFNATIDPDGGVSVLHFPEAQKDAEEAADKACVHKFGYDKQAKPTEAQSEAIYAGRVAATQCLKKYGYVYDQVPSEQAFLDGAVFDPFLAVDGPGAKNPASYPEWLKLKKECPEP